jgi:hypothetical protein
MRIPMRYGESRIEHCPFCNKQAIMKNSQDVPVCAIHKDSALPEMKCMCGAYLLMQKGKFGVYFNCLKCGNVSLKKALDINNIASLSHDTPKTSIMRRVGDNIVIRSDDPDFFD